MTNGSNFKLLSIILKRLLPTIKCQNVRLSLSGHLARITSFERNLNFYSITNVIYYAVATIFHQIQNPEVLV